MKLSELKASIAHAVAIHPHLNGIRNYNHQMMQEFAKCLKLPTISNKTKSIEGAAILDLGASIFGFALESSLELGASRYEGIDIDIARHWQSEKIEVIDPRGRVGRLTQMNADHIDFPDESFDGVFTISTFEHFLNPDRVLNEIWRVLKPDGRALLNCEPIWSASNGHHLHHFGALSQLAPPWGHLILSKELMLAALRRQAWPADAPVSPEQAVDFIYNSNELNRLTAPALRQHINQSKMKLWHDWPLLENVTSEKQVIANYVSQCTGLEINDLMTFGLSVLLIKE